MSLPLKPSSQRVTATMARRPLTGLAGPLLAAVLLVMTAATAHAAAEYALSGRAADLDSIQIAQTEFGPLTALDLLICDDQGGENALASIPMEVWMDLGTLANGQVKFAIDTMAANLLATYRLGAQAGDWQPDAGQVRAMTFNAAIATWIQDQVVPQVKVEDTDIQRYYLAHADKYLERQRLQVRYIFRRADPANAAEVARVRADLEQVAFDIREKRTTFDAAAQRYSEAPSASEGGLLPPFYNGTYFEEFESQAFGLTEPGDLSRVFMGPEGLYLLQLEKIWPVSNIPIESVRDEVAAQLKYDLVRHYYAYLYEKLTRKAHVLNQAAMWNYMSFDAPIAYAGGTALTRDQFLRDFDNPTDEHFGVRWNVVFVGVARWIEGEVIMQDLARRGLDQSPWIQRADKIAMATLRGRHVLSMDVPPEDFKDAAASLATLEKQPFFKDSVRQCRLVEFEYLAQDRRDMNDAERRAAQRLATRLDEQLAAGSLPTDPNPVDLAQWTENLGDAATADLKAPLAEMRRQVAETGWANLTLNIRDFGWVNSYPGSAWNSLIGNRKTGAVSEPYRMDAQTRRYLLIAERPIDPEAMKGNALLVRQMAHDMAGYSIFLKEFAQIWEKGDITFVYPGAGQTGQAPGKSPQEKPKP